MKIIDIQGYSILKDKIQAVGPIKYDSRVNSYKFTIYLHSNNTIVIGMLDEECNSAVTVERLKALREELINTINNDLCG